MNRNEWMEQVIREVRFAPDRRRIRQELAEHMEDRMEEYLEDLGAYSDSQEEIEFDTLVRKAELRLLESMGDPVELGQELNQQHKPWLGWLWMASRVLLAVSVCLVAAMIILFLLIMPMNSMDKMDPDKKYNQMAKYYHSDYNHSGSIYYCLEPDWRVELFDTEIIFRLFAYDDYDGRLDLLAVSCGSVDIKEIALNFLCNGERPTMAQHETGVDEHGNITDVCKITYERFDREADQLHITYDKFGEHFDFTIDIASGTVTAGEVER